MRSSLPLALDVDLLGPVDHDVGDGLVLEQRLERTEAHHVVDDLIDEIVLLRPVELQAVLDQQLGDEALELAHQFLARQADRGGEIDAAHHQRLHGAARLVDLAARQPACRLVGDLRLGRTVDRTRGRRRGTGTAGAVCGGRSRQIGRRQAPISRRGGGSGLLGDALGRRGALKLVAGRTGRSTSAT